MHDESCDYGNNKPIVIARAKPAAIHLVVLDSSAKIRHDAWRMADLLEQ
jgi:hypothetical protein